MEKPKKQSKKEIEEKIENIFAKNPSPKEIKKIKKLAMSRNIKLKKFRQKFCKNCLVYFNNFNFQIRIKKPLKIIKCRNCGYISRYKLN